VLLSHDLGLQRDLRMTFLARSHSSLLQIVRAEPSVTQDLVQSVVLQ
jgi:hypothetical protein